MHFRYLCTHTYHISSHLFKLILPLGHLRSHDTPSAKLKPPPPTVFLLHPSQPLSHVSKLILASLAPSTPSISFRSVTPRGCTVQWSDSTDVQDFIRDAARSRSFTVCITDPGEAEPHTTIPVEVPSFADRTRFLRRRLAVVERALVARGLLALCARDERLDLCAADGAGVSGAGREGKGERSSPEQKGFHHSGSVDVMCAIELVQNSESGLIVLYLIAQYSLELLQTGQYTNGNKMSTNLQVKYIMTQGGWIRTGRWVKNTLGAGGGRGGGRIGKRHK